MDIYLTVHRKNLTVFIDTKDNIDIAEFKKILHGIVKVTPENLQLYTKEDKVMEDTKSLSDYGYTAATAKAQCPGLIKMVYRNIGGDFEPIEIVAYSTPPELPYVMKTHETTGIAD